MRKEFDKKILKEINRFNSIGKYINEQENFSALGGGITPVPNDPLNVPPPPQASDPGLIPSPMTNDTEIIPAIDPNQKAEVGDETEELEITDLVNNQKEIEEKQKEYFKGLFRNIDDLSKKLSSIDQILLKISELEQKIEKYKPKTPEEKLELRTLDSAPFKQNLRDYFVEKEPELEKSGKEYVLTSDEVTNFSPKEISDSFSPPEEKDEINFNKFRNF